MEKCVDCVMKETKLQFQDFILEICCVVCLKNGSFYLYCTHFEFLKFECYEKGVYRRWMCNGPFSVPGRAYRFHVWS